MRDNDQDAWRRLVNLYSPLVGHWFRQWGAAPDDVPDLLQEVFSSVSRHLSSYRSDGPGSSFRGWIRTIARNKFLDHVRARSTPAEGGTEARVRLEGVVDTDILPDASDSDSEITELYLRALDQVRAQFEERTWRAFWLVAMERRGTADVAAELGLSPNSVRQARSRVLRRLKQELGELIA